MYALPDYFAWKHSAVLTMAVCVRMVCGRVCGDCTWLRLYIQSYDTGSVCKLAAQFPDEPNRVLICHGLMDENVHFVNTALLTEALAKEGKPYHLQVGV